MFSVCLFVCLFRFGVGDLWTCRAESSYLADNESEGQDSDWSDFYSGDSRKNRTLSYWVRGPDPDGEQRPKENYGDPMFLGVLRTRSFRTSVAVGLMSKRVIQMSKAFICIWIVVSLSWFIRRKLLQSLKASRTIIKSFSYGVNIFTEDIYFYFSIFSLQMIFRRHKHHWFLWH